MGASGSTQLPPFRDDFEKVSTLDLLRGRTAMHFSIALSSIPSRRKTRAQVEVASSMFLGTNVQVGEAKAFSNCLCASLSFPDCACATPSKAVARMSSGARPLVAA